LALPQPVMAGQGDTGAAEQSSRLPPSADSLAAVAEAASAAAMRLNSAHTRVSGEAYVHLWFPARDTPVGSDAVADADPAAGATAASRAERFFPTYIYACRNTTPAEGGHRQIDGGSTERAVGHPSHSPFLFPVYSLPLPMLGELAECPQLTDSPHFFVERGLFPRDIA